MSFIIASSPYEHNQLTTSALMRMVILALIPGIFAQWYFFGWGNLIQISLAIVVALLTEFFVLSVRNKPINTYLFDGSAILTAVLLGIAVPALEPVARLCIQPRARRPDRPRWERLRSGRSDAGHAGRLPPAAVRWQRAIRLRP